LQTFFTLIDMPGGGGSPIGCALFEGVMALGTSIFYAKHFVFATPLKCHRGF
jgi:hypothetical protein